MILDIGRVNRLSQPAQVGRRTSAGFSAVELIGTVALIGILAAIAFPVFASHSAAFRVQSAGREVYAALQEVRQQAIMRGTRTRLQVQINSYTLQWEDVSTWRTIRGPIGLESGVELTSTGGDLTFQPRGTVSPLGTLTVSDPLEPEHRLVINVPVTGLVWIQQGGN